jgi:hypothetical protein
MSQKQAASKDRQFSEAQRRRVGVEIRAAISELDDAAGSASRNELGMRCMMALIRLSNAFMEADYPPLEMLVPVGDGVGKLLTWKAAPGPRRRQMLGADPVGNDGRPLGDLFADRMGNPIESLDAAPR